MEHTSGTYERNIRTEHVGGQMWVEHLGGTYGSTRAEHMVVEHWKWNIRVRTYDRLHVAHNYKQLTSP